MGTERADDGTQFSVIQFGTARRGPWFGLWAGGTKDRLSGAVQSFFDVVPIQDLNGLGKQLPGGVPDPGGTIAEQHATWRFGEAAPSRFAQYALGEIGPLRVGILCGGTFNRSRIGDRSRIPLGFPWSSRDSAVQRVTTLASRVFAEPSGCLPARSTTSELRMGTPVPSSPRYTVGATSPVGSTQLCSSAAISTPKASAARST